MNINPFDDDNSSFFVLINDDELHSLWPTFADLPARRRMAYGEAGHGACPDYIEQSWTDIRLEGARLAEGRALERKALSVGGVGWNLMTGPFR